MQIHWERGELLTVSKLNGLNPVTRKKLRTESVTLDDAISSDTDLILPLKGGLTYDIFGLFIHRSAANAAGDFQCAIGWSPWPATGTWTPFGSATGLASGTQDSGNWDVALQDAASPTTGIGFGSSTSDNGVRVRGRIAVGDLDTNLVALWAQIAANASATSFVAGSWLTAIPVL
jgi:hypothetical protein